MLESRMMLSSDLSFNITYDSSISTLPQAEQSDVESSVNSIVNEYVGDFSVAYPTTININVAYTPDPTVLAESLPTLEPSYTYAQIRAALLAAVPGDAPELPATDPTGGGSFQTTSAEAKALGLPLSDSPTAIDGYVMFGDQPWTFYPNQPRAQANDYDFTGGMEHEFSEVMGRVSDLTQGNQYCPLDLFRYSGPGARSIVDLQQQSPDGNEVAPVAYFSLDSGTTNLRYFDNTVGDDIHDWNGYNNDSYDAEGLPDDAYSVSSLDIQEMDALGYGASEVTGPTPTPTSPTPTPTPGLPTPAPTPTPAGPAPLAVLSSAPPTTTPGSATPYTFSVTYTDAAGLNASSLRADDVVVVAPNGAAIPVTFGSTTVVSSTQDVVTYNVSPPQAGEYRIFLIAGQVTDNLGDTAPGQSLGAFDAVVPSPGAAGSSATAGGVAVLTPTQVTETIPADVTAGARFRGTVTADLSESGAGAFEGPVSVSLYAAPTDSLAGATLISTATTGRIYLTTGQTKAVDFRVSSLPASLAQGTYYIILQVDSAVGGAFAASTGTVTVSPSSISLSGAIAALAASVAPGRSASAVLNLTNGGTVPANGVLEVLLYARPTGTSGSADASLGTTAIKIHIKPDGNGHFRIHFQVPAGLAAGSYALVAQLVPNSTFGQSSLAGPIVSSTTFTVG